ncbi:ectoine synthase [Umezawaea sp. NPDC059074]|uniref:ectoine synthase n=1 Tax=Umezawaea sp. NPDC059074 TaxID=3346716 RepID=UPI003685D749
MIVRTIDDAKVVDWGNGLSRRFLLAGDGLGYSITDTIVTAGTKSRLQYRNHLEACYCIEGAGEVVDLEGNSFPLTPGTLYALDKNDAHYLIASPEADLRLVCVFSPALHGDERHSLDEPEFSHY